MGRQMSYLIVGNGIAGVSAAEVLRAEDPTCKLTIIADEPFPVYYRPALKDYLAGRVAEDKLWARPSTFYREQRINFARGRVVGINGLHQVVQLQDGKLKQYDKLLLANGARARRLNCPGLELEGVSTLRSIADYQRLRQRLADVRQVVVCGSGTLALETAETLVQQGYKVTHLLRGRTFWSEILDGTGSDLVLQEERRKGIDVHLEEEVSEVIGKDGRVVGVHTTRGAHIPCQIVLIAIGIEPHIEFARAGGIACGRGIKVDAAMRTNVKNIYAAGDVVESVINSATGATRVVGQWYPAIQQAHRAAESMLGRTSGQGLVRTGSFYNATFLCGLDFVAIGETAVAAQGEYQEYRADPEPRSYRKIMLQQGRPIGALFLGNRKNALAFKRAIDHSVNLASIADSLFAPAFELDEWLDMRNVPPVSINSADQEAIAADRSIKSSPPLRIQTATLPLAQPITTGAMLIPVPHPEVHVALKDEQLQLPQQGEPITIGRQWEANLDIQHPSVSRRHAQITYEQGQYKVSDIGSANGTYVNKRKLPQHAKHTLRPNDMIRFGDVQFSFQRSEPAAEEEAGLAVVEGASHRRDIRPLSEQRIRFEIDMCIGCDRCMDACPVPFSTQVTIAELNMATIAPQISPTIARFTQECILCGSCVPVCPVDNHRDLLMVSLKQRQGTLWESQVDEAQLRAILPSGMTLAEVQQRLRAQRILSSPAEVPESYLQHLMLASSFQFIEAGSIVFREGEYGRDLYMILDGQLTISAQDVHEQEFAIAVLEAGEMVGEYGPLTGQPYTMTARAQKNTLVLRVPEQVIQRLMELVPGIRQFFEQANGEHTLISILKRMSLFQGISDEALRYLIGQTQVKSYERNTRLFTESGAGQPAREALHILLEGFVKVARHKTEKPGEERIVAYRQGGDYFAGGLDLLGDSRAVSATTINRTRVAEVPEATMQKLFQQYPEVKQRFRLRLQEYIASYNSVHTRELPAQATEQVTAGRARGTHRDELHALVDNGVIEGTEVLVIDLDTCIHCNECEYACEQRHGHSRLNRQGMVIGNITIATTCRQCQDPVCMLCSRAGIARLPNGEVYITESCIGCGICAERCPYHAISIVDIENEVEAQEASSWQRFSNLFRHGSAKERKRPALPMLNTSGREMESRGRVAPGPLDKVRPYSGYDEIRKKIAIKCDLCAGYGDQACVQACPTGAAFRVHPTTFFGSTEKILQDQALMRKPTPFG